VSDSGRRANESNLFFNIPVLMLILRSDTEVVGVRNGSFDESVLPLALLARFLIMFPMLSGMASKLLLVCESVCDATERGRLLLGCMCLAVVISKCNSVSSSTHDSSSPLLVGVALWTLISKGGGASPSSQSTVTWEYLRCMLLSLEGNLTITLGAGTALGSTEDDNEISTSHFGVWYRWQLQSQNNP